MSLETLAKSLAEKGFVRQAVLLRSRTGTDYVRVLLQPQWHAHVKEAVGRHLYGLLEQYYESTEEEKILKAIFGEEKPTLPRFQSREYSLAPLEIKIEHTFDFSTLQKAADLTKKAAALQIQAHTLIYTEVQERVSGNEDLLYEMYKDTDHVPEQLQEQDIRRLKQEYSGMLSRRVSRLKRLLQLNAPSVIISNETAMLSAAIPPFDYIEGSAFQQETQQLFTNLMTGETHNEEWEQEWKRAEKRESTIASVLVTEGEQALQNKPELEDKFQQWLLREQHTKKQRVGSNAREIIQNFGTIDIGFHDQSASLFDQIYIFSDENLAVDLMNEEGEQLFSSTSASDKLRQLYKSPLSIRESFLTNRYKYSVKQLSDLLAGLQQLAAGGPMTNPDASLLSVLQNHSNFPNIHYSSATMSSIEEIVAALKPLLEELPDISDVATSTKMRKRKEYTYLAEELPKDPLDVTFGNDSGCCVFVPEKNEALQNGLFVPAYLRNHHIRLFAIYRKEGEKKQRVGLVPAFETVSRHQGRILACNSTELSRFGISGGNDTIRKLVEYVENYLVAYAQEFGYKGCTMGRHNYNTSANFSSKVGMVVDEQLEFVQSGRTFYSDIFRWDAQQKVMKTRQNSCYWLWKKE